jgi:rhamnose transport system permease protein
MNSRERAVGFAILALAAVMALLAPSYFTGENLSALFFSNVPVLIVALGMTVVILTGQIDISVGSVFAIASVATGVFAKWGMPAPLAGAAACAVGAMLGSLNGALVAYARVPSIVTTLAAMIALRDLLRWSTQGEWIQNLPAGFPWFGLPQPVYSIAVIGFAVAISIAMDWGSRNLSAGRAVYATGSNPEAARLAGIRPPVVVFGAFVLLGALTGLAAAINAVRFQQIPSNEGIGLEMKVIAAVVVGGTAISGGAGSIRGTVLGVILLAAVGPALTFLGISAYWERAVQGTIILAAVVIEAMGKQRERHAVRA